MGRLSRLDVECAVPLAVRDELQPSEIDAILGIVFLAAAADGALADEEADAFIRIMLRLFGQQATPERIRAVMQQIAARVQRGESCQAARCARVGELAAMLRRTPARELAYKLSYVMLMSDLQTNDDEFAFDVELRRVLGIAPERVEELQDEASRAVLGEPSRRGRGAPTCAGEAPAQIDLPFADAAPPAMAAQEPSEAAAPRARAARGRAAAGETPRRPGAGARRKSAGKAPRRTATKAPAKAAKQPPREAAHKTVRRASPKRPIPKKAAGKKASPGRRRR